MKSQKSSISMTHKACFKGIPNYWDTFFAILSATARFITFAQFIEVIYFLNYLYISKYYPEPFSIYFYTLAGSYLSFADFS
jgi:hypothetical protein